MAVNSVLLKTETSNFQEMLSYLYATVHIEKNTTVHYGWSENVMRTSKIYPFLCECQILAFCFALLGFFSNCDFLPTINHVPTLLTNAEKFDTAASDIHLLVSKITKNVSKHITSSAFLAVWDR